MGFSGGDDVQQLCDAGEDEFLEIMALVGMASKPLHVRRFQKALAEWVSNPSAFKLPLSSMGEFHCFVDIVHNCNLDNETDPIPCCIQSLYRLAIAYVSLACLLQPNGLTSTVDCEQTKKFH